MSQRRVRIPLLALVLAAAPASAQQGTERGAYIVRLGTDTIAVERFTRSRDRLEGDIVARVPQVRVIHYVATLGPDGSVSRFESSMRPLNKGPIRPVTATIQFGDSVRQNLKIGDSTATVTLAAARGAVPIVSSSYALYEQAIRQMKASGKDSLSLDLVFVGQRQPFATTLVRTGDSVRVDFFGDPAFARLDRSGRLTSYQGLRTTNKVVVERTKTADIERLAQAFASRESSAGPAGPLSPRDTVRAVVGGANLMIDYGRPHKRGRAIYGSVVPYGQVWRTGANAATQFSTDADLLVAGQMIPAGKYTLWTVPTPTGATLIVNKETGQWGTEYKEAQDLVRIPMTTDRLPSEVEQFTIAIVPQGEAGVLQLQWDTTALSVPISVKR